MNDMSQLASAMVTVTFAAGMLIAGHLYIESKSAAKSLIAAAQASPLANPNREDLAFSVETPPALQSTQFRHRRQQ